MDLYFARHDGQAVTCDDFVRAMQDASGEDLEQFRAGTARRARRDLRAKGRYDDAAREYVLDVEQFTPPTPGQPQKQPFHVPLAVGPHRSRRARRSAAPRGRGGGRRDHARA